MKYEDKIRMIRKIKLSIDDSKIIKSKYQDDGLENACWEGYEPRGLKEKDGRMVPNCVPVEAKKVKQGFPIPSPSGDEDEQGYVSRCMKEIGGEYDQDQALAICYSKWREK